MSSLNRIAAYHRTRGGLLIFGFAELLLAFLLIVVASWTTSGYGSWAYIPASLAAICLFGFFQNMARLVISWLRHESAVRQLPRKYAFALIYGAIFIILTPGLVVNFLWLMNVPAITLPARYYACPADPISSCVCFGTNFDITSYDRPEGFPFVTRRSSWDCTPPSALATWLDTAAAGLVAALVAAGAVWTGSVIQKRLQRGRQAAAA